MEVLLNEVSHLGEYDENRNDNSEQANKRRAILLAAEVPTIAANFHRPRQNEKVLDPKEEYGFAENFL
jgi:citrate synthase